MDTDNITIRPGRVDDAPFIGLVVCMALHYDDSHPFYGIFTELASRTDAQYSYCNALIAEIDGKAAGAIVGYNGALLHRLREPLQALVKQQTGCTIDIEDETGPGEFYLDSLAVLPQYRGMGIGSKLLRAMREQAFRKGFTRVGLLVDVDNPDAEALYASLDFRRINPTTFLGHKMWHMQSER